jgi:hypothetical protein
LDVGHSEGLAYPQASSPATAAASGGASSFSDALEDKASVSIIHVVLLRFPNNKSQRYEINPRETPTVGELCVAVAAKFGYRVSLAFVALCCEQRWGRIV